MRNGAGLFGLLCGLVIILINARYGYRTADTDADGYMVGFFYGAISFAGLFGHALAARLWKNGFQMTALLVGGVCFAALLVSLSNSLGAIGGRGDQIQAKRLQIAATARVTNRSLDLAQKKLEGLTFTPTDEAMVKAVKALSDAATAAKDDECKFVRGRKCEARVADEQKTLAALTEASKNKSLTDSAAALNLEIAGYQKTLKESGPVLEVNSQGAAIARLFDLPDSKASFLSTWQNFLMGAIVELIAVVFLIAYEALDPKHSQKIEPETPGRREEPIVFDPLPETEDKPKAFPVPSRPRLIAAEAKPMGNVASIIADLIESGRGKTEIADLYSAYAEACHEQGKAPVDVDAFGLSIRRICRDIGIQIAAKKDGVYLMKVRLKNVEGGLDLLEQRSAE
jgi:hypothetical protein